MGRNVKPGISYYRVDSGHILDKKVRLLVNEFDSDGYYIWRCIEDYAYSNYGYYFPITDNDELELFASEYCKKKLSLVKEVIEGCLRRGLYDERLAAKFGVLTSEYMQETFLVATYDRRRNGALFTMIKDYVMLPEQKHISYVNIAFCYVTNSDLLRNETTEADKAPSVAPAATQPNNKPANEKNSDKNISKDNRNGVLPLPSEKNPPTKDGILNNVPVGEVGGSSAPAPLEPGVPARRVIRKQPEVQYWKALVDVWFNFYSSHFKNEETGAPAKPDFDNVQGNFLKKIISKLEKVATQSDVTWTEKQAIRYLNRFLNKAWEKDPWVQRNFELANLLSKFNSIINTNEAIQQAPGTAAKGNNGSKQPTGADLITARLKQNLQFYAAAGGADDEGEI